MRHLYKLTLLAILFSTACTPLRVVRLEPAQDQAAEYLYGNAVAVAKAGDAEVKASYFDSDHEVVIFHLEVRNDGREPITYDPVDATLQTPSGQVLNAIDPEVELLTYDLDQLRKIRNGRALTAVGGALVVAGTVAAITSGGDDFGAANDFAAVNNQQVYTDLTFTVLDATLTAALYRNIPLEPADLPESSEREFWLDYAMRRTTIQPGEVAIGKLVFPRVPVEGSFELATTVEGELAKFEFRQRVFR